MNTKHIKRLQYTNGTWIIELWNSQIITDHNLAIAIEAISEITFIQPVPVSFIKLAPELEAA